MFCGAFLILAETGSGLEAPLQREATSVSFCERLDADVTSTRINSSMDRSRNISTNVVALTKAEQYTPTTNEIHSHHRMKMGMSFVMVPRSAIARHHRRRGVSGRVWMEGNRPPIPDGIG